MQIDPAAIQQYVQQFGLWAPIVFIGLFTVGTILFLPSIPFLLAAGLLFGPLRGFGFVMIGMVLSASAGFVIARKLGEPYVDRWLKGQGRKFAVYEDRLLHRHGWFTVFVLRVLPVFPLAVVNYGLGLTHVSWKHYMFGTFFGIMPAVWIYTYLGGSFDTENYIKLFIPLVLFVLFATLVFVLKKRYPQ